jgi:hypothetical protein
MKLSHFWGYLRTTLITEGKNTGFPETTPDKPDNNLGNDPRVMQSYVLSYQWLLH